MFIEIVYFRKVARVMFYLYFVNSLQTSEKVTCLEVDGRVRPCSCEAGGGRRAEDPGTTKEVSATQMIEIVLGDLEAEGPVLLHDKYLHDSGHAL